MAIDRTPSSDDENEELGVLDEPGTSTTAIDLGMTAQVSVVLPAGYQDDDHDDDVIADEFDHWTDDADDADDPEAADHEDEAAGRDDIVLDDDASEDDVDHAPDAGEGEDDRSAGDDEAGDAAGPDEGEEIDDADDSDDSDDADDGADDIDEVNGTDADERDGDEAGEAVDTSDLDEVDTSDLEADDAEDVVAAPDSDEDNTDEGPGLDEVEAEAEAEAVEDVDEAHVAEVADDLDDESDAPSVISPDEASPDEPADADLAEADLDESRVDPTVDAQPDTVQENIIVREPDPVPAAVSSETANRVEKAARVGRESFVRQPRGEARRDPEASDVLTDDRLLDTGAIRKPEPEDPWRRIIYAATRGVINLGDGKKTRARKELMARIALPIPGRVRFVPVMSRKGGVGKTTVTALLGMALADARDDRVVAIDANPDRGTLAERISKPSGKTVRDLVRSHSDITGYADMTAHVTRDQTRLDVLASDADPHVADAFSDQNYRDVAEIAQHYYSLVLTDTGTGIIHSVMDATLDLGDQVVIVSGISVDEARLAAETLTWLETNGHEELARNAVVVINQDRPGTPLVRLDELETHFRSRVRDVVRIPYDVGIATGSAITFHELDRSTRDAARRLAASVVEGIRAS